jgi:hypothetical protein
MATEKMLRITMPDASVWEVPAKVVARDRATNYEDDPDCDFEGEFDFAMGDEMVLLDWAGNNMDWTDVADQARKVSSRAPLEPADFQDGWVNGDKEVVEVEVPDVIDAEFPDPEPGHVRIGEVIAVWDLLHEKDTGEIGFCDLEKALVAAGIKVDSDTRPPRKGPTF